MVAQKVLVVALMSVVSSAARADDAYTKEFAAFVDEYYQGLFTWDPTQATYAGVHDYDHRLPDFSAKAFADRVAALKKQLARLKALQSAKRTLTEAIDAEILDHAIRAEMLEAEEIRSYLKNPMLYLGKPAEGIDLLMKRSFAPAPDRLKAVIGRLKAAPALVAAMKENVRNSPRELVDLGLIVAQGTIGFFKDDLKTWATKAAGADSALLAEFTAADQAAVDAFQAGAKFINDELLPNAKGSYAIGADAFMKKLATEEMLDIPLDRLLSIGEANLKKDREAFINAAAQIAPGQPPAKALTLLTDDHPQPNDLVRATRATIERTRRFLIQKRIVTVPSEVRPTIAETPGFMRTGAFASMDTPGAYETKATEAFYYVTPPEQEWPMRRKIEHMRQFNVTAMDVITIHEAFPGHYLQFLNAKNYPTKVRKLYTCGTNVEGWAHYTEQMCVDEGFGGGGPRIRLAQLSEALLRDCRYIVGIKLHTEGWTVEQGKQFFVEQGWIEPEVAFQESRRGTYNPTYLYYTLGKLQILKFREDYKKANGPAFNLKDFHDQFVRQGGIPIKLIRKIMLPGDDGPTL